MKLLLAGILVIMAGTFALVFAPSKATAADPPICAYYYDDIMVQYGGIEVPEADLANVLMNLEADTGLELDGATRVFFVMTETSIVFGVELDGCLLDPIIVSVPLTPVNGLSGRVGDLTFA